MDAYRTLGRQPVKAEFTRRHCQHLARWFNPRGAFVHYGHPPSSRERLWNCMSLLAEGSAKCRQLARAIILKTPTDPNHFEPFAAVELLLRFPDRLDRKTAGHLTGIVREHLLNSMEFRFGTAGAHNFSSMCTWFLLGASQVLDGYEWHHPLGSIPEVYTRSRLRDIGMNSLYALAYLSEHEPVFTEWNSPTYSPISLHCMAKIVELIDDPAARRIALQVELKLWREILSLYHPRLGLSCGPWSRAYRCDILGQNSQMRILLAYLGLSKDRSVAGLFDTRQKDLIFHHDGDVPFTWSGPAWQMAGRFHVPSDALSELRHRRFPHRFEAPVQWGPHGHIDPHTRKYVSVQGQALPGGTARIVQVQRPNWALGHRTLGTLGHSFAINLHYALVPRVRTMRDVRNVTAAVVFRQAPPEWVPDPKGRPMEASNFNNEGRVEVSEDGRDRLTFAARPFGELACMPSDELSINAFVPLHFVPIGQATLNGVPYQGRPLAVRAARALCRVRDAGFVFDIEYAFPSPVELRLYRWSHFLRFAGFWYEGAARSFTPDQLRAFRVKGRFAVTRTA